MGLEQLPFLRHLLVPDQETFPAKRHRHPTIFTQWWAKRGIVGILALMTSAHYQFISAAPVPLVSAIEC